MAITRMTDDMGIISKLSDRPNDTDGLTAAGLKAKFDEGGGTVKDYINNTLLPFLESAAAAANLGVDTVTGLSAETVQAALEEIVQNMVDITQGSVADGSITTAKLAAGAVATNRMADGAVATAKIAANAVTTAKIALLAITTALLADGAVTAAKLGSGAVTEDKLGAAAVTTGKIASAAVDNTKLAEAAVTAVKIAANAVTAAKIAAGAVTAEKLGSDVLPLNVGIKMGTADPTTSDISEGQIYIKYTPGV